MIIWSQLWPFITRCKLLGDNVSWQRAGGGQGTQLLALRLGPGDSIMHKDQPVITGEMGGDSRGQFTFCLGASWETERQKTK